MAAFEALGGHAWYGRAIASLSRAELQLCRNFIVEHSDLGNDAFVLALNRWMLDRERPKRWTIMLDLLQAAATAERCDDV